MYREQTRNRGLCEARGEQGVAGKGIRRDDKRIDKKKRGKMMEYPKYKKVLFCTGFYENSDYAFEFAFGISKRD